MKIAFSQLLEQAQAQSNGAPPDVVVKELLHYEILKALGDSELAREVTFQGGSALRFFYDGQRYSEDLDFVIGSGENKGFVVDGMVELLKRQMTDRYGFELEVKPPSHNEFNGISVRTWQFKIAIPGLQRKQMIKVEFCNVPAHDVGARLVKPRYGFLNDTHATIMLRVESEREIMADKLTAIANRKYIKARDLWDLKFLADRGVTPDFALVKTKLRDYGALDFAQKIDESIARLSANDAPAIFMAEMEKFVSPSIIRGLKLMTPSGEEHVQFALGHMINLQRVLVTESHLDQQPAR